MLKGFEAIGVPAKMYSYSMYSTGDFPPECDKQIITSSKSEATAENVCFTVESGCIEPVNSLPLTFELFSGNGLELFRLDSNAPPNNNIGLCTNSSLKNRYGDWTVSSIWASLAENVLAVFPTC